MAQADELRLIVDPARPGTLNMATDEAILEAVGAGEAPATLRFYQWDAPTISLGYFQKHDELGEQDEAVRELAVVRRQTGGGAILHDDELTYSLALRIGESGETDIESMYRLVHDAFISVLAGMGVVATYRGGDDRGNAQRGPFFCFARTHRLDLVLGTDKLLGSAQRRVKNAVLQHGSLILGRHFRQQPSAAVGAVTEGTFDSDSFAAKVADVVAGALELKVKAGELTNAEQQRLTELQAKYGGPDWTEQR